MRCFVCKKRLYLNSFSCKCSSNLYCTMHRLDHNCTYDYFSNNKNYIKTCNQKITKAKIDKI